MIYVAVYVVIGALWGAFAGRMQFKSGLSTRVDWGFCCCIVANVLAWPLGMLCAWLENRADR